MGQLLVAGGFVSQQDVEKVLQKQRDTNKKIGELLVEEGLLDPLELSVALEIQDKLSNPIEGLRLASGIRKKLGEILLYGKKITSEQLEKALAIQKETGEKLGEILVRLGYITPSDLNIALHFQDLTEKNLPNNLKLGEILVKAKIITKDQLKRALEVQKLYPEKKIGEILIELGFIDKKGLEWALNFQHKLVSALLAGLFTLSSLWNVSIVDARENVGQRGSSTKVFVYAYVKSYAKINILSQKGNINITEEDIKRGYIDVKEAVRFKISTNSREVCLNIDYNQDGFLNSAKAYVMGQELRLGKGGGIVILKNVKRSFEDSVDFTLELKKDISPGIYPLPFSFSVAGL